MTSVLPSSAVVLSGVTITEGSLATAGSPAQPALLLGSQEPAGYSAGTPADVCGGAPLPQGRAGWQRLQPGTVSPPLAA